MRRVAAVVLALAVAGCGGGEDRPQAVEDYLEALGPVREQFNDDDAAVRAAQAICPVIVTGGEINLDDPLTSAVTDALRSGDYCLDEAFTRS